ncbi:uncharacterized protein LOC100242197 isoform X2 [Vitis vinifera]|uniref:uncharacterized protein LOC100242197 isoform X2 n=1 Tax=Vitis vinifera TaxID=29760 RepID=UPI00053F592E|nr:uncharacterized protein LOC100242197 isoform X2 [Vitis vinifera]|eukprot:XP_010657973.1 PREDICTED: uncharacterized protein LOC100242197 isoform X2 [Vitis vinifera]
MGDLYTSSMACSTSLHHRSSLGWDLHNLGVFNADMSLVMDNSTAPFFSCLDSDPSTGYLQDALVEFSDRSKRRRLLLYTDHETNSPNDLMKTYWNMNPNCTWDLSENFNCMNQIASIGGVSAEPINGSAMSGMISEEEPTFADMKTPEETVSALEALDSSSSSYKEYSVNTKSVSEKDTLCSIDPLPPSTVVKPGGLDGDMTLNDINERILMPPTRPVRHPVGDFASRPFVSPDGPGLSGKAVVALTRIHTQGRGTITIIRTKG